MNFDDLQKAWQSQTAGPRIALDVELLLNEVRRNQRTFTVTIFWRDVREVGVAIFLTWLFSHWAIRDGEWSLFVLAFGCFFVAAFILVDRWIQHKKRPVANDSLRGCVESSLAQVAHQIWLLKNVFWWYLLPISIGLGLCIASQAWRAGHSALIGLAIYTVFCALLYWGIYWLNQYAVRKHLEPRRQELETLRVSLGQNS